MSTQAPQTTRFSTPAEVATVLRVSKMTVYRLVHSGQIPAVRVGRSFRIPTQGVWDYLSGAEVSLEDIDMSYAPAVPS